MKRYSNFKLLLFGVLGGLLMGAGIWFVKRTFNLRMDPILTGKPWFDLPIEAAVLCFIFLFLRKMGLDGFLLKKRK